MVPTQESRERSDGKTVAETKASTVSPQAIARLRAELRGTLLEPRDPGYSDARRIWNGMIDRHPGLIARCAGTADIRTCIGFVREQGLSVSVRGGGHNIAGSSLCEGGLVIDLSAMRSVHVDPLTRRAFVDPGATLADFDHEAQAFALATPLGINSTTGVAGLTLGGGFGWLSRMYGLTVDNLLSADVITAHGELLHSDEQTHPDLFWALRGGGGNFGIVSRFEFGLHHVGPEVASGLVVYPAAQAKQVLTAYRELVETLPDESSVWVLLRKAPPLPFLPSDVHGQPVIVLAMFHAGSEPAAGLAQLDPFRRLGPQCGEHVGLTPYRAWQRAFDPLLGPGARNYWKSHNFHTLNDAVIDIALDHLAALPSPQCEIFFGLLGGRAAKVDAAATAYPHRDAKLVLNVHARWETPDRDAACIGWARSLFGQLAPHASGGVYVNFLNEDERDRIQAAYGLNYPRLVETKRRYDPSNLFRANQNILP